MSTSIKKYIHNTTEFGSNTYIVNKSDNIYKIQNKINEIYTLQEKNQFGSERTTILFEPGTYNLNLPLGFYTSIYGLGQSPRDVEITGKSIYSNSYLHNDNSTCNFWRSVENLTVTPVSGTMKWAVSQACPFRKIHVKGNMNLHQNRGWASGGYIADSVIEGNVDAGSQQQWYSRNSYWESWSGHSWNMVFQGMENAPNGEWPEIAYTNIQKTPIIREKPYLYLNNDANYSVFIPSIRKKSSGSTWNINKALGTSLPISDFHIVREEFDNASTINQALSSGKNLIFSPGYYQLNSTINVNRPNTIILGLGFATIVPISGKKAMSVADVEGVIIAGLMFEAGKISSPELLNIGEPDSNTDFSINPVSLHDLVFRVGGYKTGSTTTAIKINSNNVIGDHFWIWRADHGINSSVGWEINKSDYGLIVNGNNVTIYGLFVEHFQKYNTLWNGENGKTYFYQCELAYDVPNQKAWMDKETKGFAAYKVAESVENHKAWGFGIYSVFTLPGVQLESAIEVPEKKGIIFKNMITLNLNKGENNIKNIINKKGKSVGEYGNFSSRLNSYG